MGGYAPVPAIDDEEEKRRLAAAYPAPSPVAPAAPAPTPAPAAPALGSTADLEARAAQPPRPYPAPEPAIQAPAPAAAARPEWSQYAPAEKHGWGKFGSIMASLNPISNEIVNRRPMENAQRNYQAATSDFDKGQADKLAQQKETSEEGLRGAQTTEANARADALQHPKPAEAEQPLANTNQANQMLARRFQVLHPGQALPPDYTLPPNATSGDYARVDKSLEAEEKAIGIKQTGDVHEADRQQSVNAEAARHADSEKDRGEARSDRLQRQSQLDTEKQTHQSEQAAQKHQVERDKFTEPLQSAIDNADYQKTYAESGNHTGTGDYTMMLQLQEAVVAGQKAGIRFNTAEQARIEHAQNLMNSARAKWGHLTGGTYFSDDQRHEIADAMQHVSLIHKQAIDRWDREHGGGQAQPGGGGQHVSFKVGNDIYDIPPDKVKAFQAKHPDAAQQ